MQKECEKEWIYVYVKLNHLTVHLKLTQIVNQLYSNKIETIALAAGQN